MKKPVKIPTPSYLANAALHYLSRYAASESSLRRVLENKIRRAAMQDAAFAADGARQRALRDEIEKIIAIHKRTGAINDEAFASAKVHSLRRQGRSGRLIRQKLSLKGVAAKTVEAALDAYNDGAEAADVELAAARAFAKRRRLGPFRPKPADFEQRRKDAAALARGGFPMDIIRKIIDATDLDLIDEN